MLNCKKKTFMKKNNLSRRKFISTASVAVIGSSVLGLNNIYGKSNDVKSKKDIVSIVRVKDGNVAKAVEEAIDLLGGIKTVTRGKNSILLKPNLVAPDKHCTTKPEVIKTIAQLMLKSGKEVMIGEASAAAESFNVIGNDTCYEKPDRTLSGYGILFSKIMVA
jgi:hypothetical protein